MVTRACVRPEPISLRAGGGHVCTGPCGAHHLHGPRWKWWRCPVCRPASKNRIDSALARLVALYYPGPS